MDPEEKGVDAPFYSVVDSVEALDAHTVKFTLKYPSVTLLPVMAANRTGFFQMSPASYKGWGQGRGAVASRGDRAVPARPLGLEPDYRARQKPPVLQARAALSGSYRVAYHEGGGHTGDVAAH